MSKYSAELKIAACRDYLQGELSCQEIFDKYDINNGKSSHYKMLYRWVHKYRAYGENAFIHYSRGNRCYSASEKLKIVEEYLEGQESLEDISIKHGIPSSETLRQWVLLYNANRTLKDYIPKREVYMAGARRKTTIEERKEIVEFCLSHNRDYKTTASLYGVSYSQVYSWVKKYDSTGEKGLEDKRGHHKKDDEVDELEHLRRENKRLKRQLEENDMVVQLLKKVKEFERM